MPMTPRVLLSVAASERVLERWQLLPLQLHRVNFKTHDFRLFSELLSPPEAHGRHPKADKAALQKLMLRRSMSTAPPNDPKRQEQRQGELEAKTAAKILKEKLKKDMETARSLVRQCLGWSQCSGANIANQRTCYSSILIGNAPSGERAERYYGCQNYGHALPSVFNCPRRPRLSHWLYGGKL